MNKTPPENKMRSEADLDRSPGFLVIRLTEGERLMVGSAQVVVNSVLGNKVTIAIKADKETKIYRPDRQRS